MQTMLHCLAFALECPLLVSLQVLPAILQFLYLDHTLIQEIKRAKGKSANRMTANFVQVAAYID